MSPSDSIMQQPDDLEETVSARREQILDAARDLIVRDGFASASMHAIARWAGMTRPALYAEFGGRDELLAALLDREEARVMAMAVAAVPEAAAGTDPAEFAEKAVGTYLDLVRSAPQSWRFVLMPAEGVPGAARERIERGRMAIRERSEFLIRTVAALNDREVDAELLSHAVIAISETAARLVLDPEGDRREAVSTTLRWLTRRAVGVVQTGKQD